MNSYFSNTLVDTTLTKASYSAQNSDEHQFIADLFNEKLVEVGHIQFIPKQNRICLNAMISREEEKTYHIFKPRLEFLKFLFEHTPNKAKKAVRFYFLNSPDAQHQRKERSKDSQK